MSVLGSSGCECSTSVTFCNNMVCALMRLLSCSRAKLMSSSLCKMGGRESGNKAIATWRCQSEKDVCAAFVCCALCVGCATYSVTIICKQRRQRGSGTHGLCQDGKHELSRRVVFFFLLQSLEGQGGIQAGRQCALCVCVCVVRVRCALCVCVRVREYKFTITHLAQKPDKRLCVKCQLERNVAKVISIQQLLTDGLDENGARQKK